MTLDKFLNPALTVEIMARDLIQQSDFLATCDHDHDCAVLISKLKSVKSLRINGYSDIK